MHQIFWTLNVFNEAWAWYKCELTQVVITHVAYVKLNGKYVQLKIVKTISRKTKHVENDSIEMCQYMRIKEYKNSKPKVR